MTLPIATPQSQDPFDITLLRLPLVLPQNKSFIRSKPLITAKLLKVSLSQSATYNSNRYEHLSYDRLSNTPLLPSCYELSAKQTTVVSAGVLVMGSPAVDYSAFADTINLSLSSPKRIKSMANLSRRSRGNLRMPKRQHGTSSAEDISSISDGGTDLDYLTDLTTPASSELYAEDMSSPDDIEEFRDREYPQLKGKTYLDHGGSTVSRSHPACPPPS